ncbi:MAG: hypothetical protein ACRD30_08695 [Bryobacteraceae bacterium]
MRALVTMLSPMVAAIAMAALLPAADLSQNAQHKLDMIQARRVRPGSVVTFTPAELNAWAQAKVPQIVPEGMRDERVDLGDGTATGYALVDFLKMRQAKGAQTNWLIARMIEGERPLRVTVRIESGDGRCTVYLTRVEVSNIAMSGGTLDFLIDTFFKPLYPDAKINEPFDLDYDIDRIEVRPDAVRVYIKK